MRRVLVVLCLALAWAGHTAAQDAPPAAPGPILRELRLDGATVYQPDDVMFLLGLRDGAPLPRDAAAVAAALQDRYARDGYSQARVSGRLEAGRLTLAVDEGRIDEIEILGAAPDDIPRVRRLLGIQPGDIYNKRVIGRATARLVQQSGGALTIGRPHRRQPGAERAGPADEITFDRRGARNVLVVPLRERAANTDTSFGSGREDLFSPVDGLSPAISVAATIFDPRHFNHAFVEGSVSYKFGRDDVGYSIGGERPIFDGPARIVLGAEVHDVTASDDMWRISSFEQTVAALGFKNSFRDYYRRRGGQLFGVLRAGASNEFSVMARWDRHQPLANATSYSFFRDDAALRPALDITDRHVNALVLGYTLDTRRLSGAGERATYARHLKDGLYGFAARQQPGLRLEWTSEIAGHGLGGGATFDRHIANVRGYLPFTSRTLLAMRGLFGWGSEALPEERRFALGGIGSVHGYAFKEVSGTRMALFNAEYRVGLGPSLTRAAHDAVHVFVCYDAGRAGGRATASNWLNGVGAGVGAGGVRVEFGFRADAIPRSRQILVRFSPTF
jgi:hypothetical protein